jgi:hypothetical protein
VKGAHRVIAALLALGLLASACTRSDSDGEENGSAADAPPSDEPDTVGDPASRLDQAAFGDLENVCGPGEGGAAEETGLTEDEIRLGTFSDKGSADRPGLNEELYDAAVAFAEWCNEHGGIQGRNVVIDDLDARLFDYGQRIAEACQRDFALVGGGAVFDNQAIDERIECGLPNIPAFLVTPAARQADLQVQPIPNPIQEFQVGIYRRLLDRDPDATNFGILWPDLGEGPAAVRGQVIEAVERIGYDVVFDEQFRVIGETAWRGYVQQMRAADVQTFEVIGEPVTMVNLQQAMQTEGWYPDHIALSSNYYDERYAAEGASSVSDTTYIRLAFPPFTMADEIPAMADYLELMEAYNPDGKVAHLGAQGVSAFLLFATAANACGSDLSRECILEEAAAVTGWTAGGLHAPHEPGEPAVPECSLLVHVTPDGFEYDEELTQPNEGIYNCDPDDVVPLEGDGAESGA